MPGKRRNLVRGFGPICVALLAVVSACSGDERVVANADTELSVEPLAQGFVAAAAPDSIVAAGGLHLDGSKATIGSSVWKWRTESATWSALPHLPDNLLAVGVASVGANTFVVARDCTSFPEATDLASDCHRTVVVRLVDGSWTVVEPPHDVVNPVSSIGLVGQVGQRYLLLELSGSPTAFFAVFDVQTSKWSTVPRPELPAEQMITGLCFSDGHILGYATGIVSSPEVTSDAVSLVALDEHLQWSKVLTPGKVKFPRNNSSSLCAADSLILQTTADEMTVLFVDSNDEPALRAIPPPAPIEALPGPGVPPLGTIDRQIVSVPRDGKEQLSSLGSLSSGNPILGLSDTARAYVLYDVGSDKMPAVQLVGD